MELAGQPVLADTLALSHASRVGALRVVSRQMAAAVWLAVLQGCAAALPATLAQEPAVSQSAGRPGCDLTYCILIAALQGGWRRGCVTVRALLLTK